MDTKLQEADFHPDEVSVQGWEDFVCTRTQLRPCNDEHMCVQLRTQLIVLDHTALNFTASIRNKTELSSTTCQRT